MMNRMRIATSSASPLGALADGSLVALASEGSEAAFETLDRRHRPAVYRHCARILRSPHDADEAAQRTMIRAYRALEKGQAPNSFPPWLLAIARNESYDLIRARKGTEQLSVEVEAGGESLTERVERRERVEELKGDLTELPEAQRRALLLRGVGDLSHAEIAELLGGTPTEMRTLVHEARASLAEFEVGRTLPCAEVRDRIATGDGRALRARRVRAHVRVCEDCAAAASAVKGGARVAGGRLAALFPVPVLAAIRAALFGGGQAGVVGAAGPVGAVGVSAAVVASVVIGLGGGIGGGGAADAAPAVDPGTATTTSASGAAGASATTSGSVAARRAATTRPARPGASAPSPAAAAPPGGPAAGPSAVTPGSPGQETSSSAAPASSGAIPGVATPSVSTPSVSTPPVSTPAVTVAPLTVPSVTVPSVTVPPVTTPALPVVGSVTTPAITVPPLQTPQISTPGITIPPLQVPGVQLPLGSPQP